jgi:hypothetical protein
MLWRIIFLSIALFLFLLPPNADSFVTSSRRKRPVERFGREFASRKYHGGPYLAISTMRSKRNDEDTDNVKEISIDNSEKQLDDDVDAFIAEQEATRRVNDRLLLPRRIATSFSKTVGALAYTFIISGFVLNFFGYAYVRDETYGFRVDTLEKKMFQEEVVRSMRSERK